MDYKKGTGLSLKRFSNWFGRASSVAIVASVPWLLYEHDNHQTQPEENISASEVLPLKQDVSSEKVATQEYIEEINTNYSATFTTQAAYEEANKTPEQITLKNNKVSIPDSLKLYFSICSMTSGISEQSLANKVFVESGFDPKAINYGTKARGLTQFLPDTALEILYEMGQDETYSKMFPITQLVERTKDENEKFFYSVVDGVDETAVIAKATYDPFLSICMATEYNKKYLPELAKTFPNRTLTSLDAYLLHWQGLGGARDIISASIKTPNKPAKELFSKDNIDAHQSLFFKEEGLDKNGNKILKPRTITEMLDYIDKDRGIDRIPIYVTEDLSGNIQLSYTGPTASDLRSAWPIGPLYVSPIPKARPETNGEIPSSLRPRERPENLQTITVAQNTPSP